MLRKGNCERRAAITCLQLSEHWKEGGAANVARTCWLDIARGLPISWKSPGPPSLGSSEMPSPDEASTSTAKTFRDLGLIEPLLQALDQINFKTPTEIQQRVLPHALEGRDIIGVAETGSGKTAAFALPILQKLWEEPKGLFACVLAPTRELAYQISQQFESLGAAMGVRCLVLIGGMDKMPQAVALAKRPHIIVATPGRLNDHLQSTKGFSLRNLKFLVGTIIFRACSQAYFSYDEGHG